MLLLIIFKPRKWRQQPRKLRPPALAAKATKVGAKVAVVLRSGLNAPRRGERGWKLKAAAEVSAVLILNRDGGGPICSPHTRALWDVLT